VGRPEFSGYQLSIDLESHCSWQELESTTDDRSASGLAIGKPETRGATAFVIQDVLCVVVGKVKVRWAVTCVLSSETEEGQLVKVGAQLLCGIKEVMRLGVLMDKADA